MRPVQQRDRVGVQQRGHQGDLAPPLQLRRRPVSLPHHLTHQTLGHLFIRCVIRGGQQQVHSAVVVRIRGKRNDVDPSFPHTCTHSVRCSGQDRWPWFGRKEVPVGGEDACFIRTTSSIRVRRMGFVKLLAQTGEFVWVPVCYAESGITSGFDPASNRSDE